MPNNYLLDKYKGLYLFMMDGAFAHWPRTEFFNEQRYH
jgi:hypothetical protein